MDATAVESSRLDPLKKTKRYTTTKTYRVRLLYTIAILLWIALIVILRLYRYGIWGLVILAIPLIVYGIAIFNASDLTVEVEESLFSMSYLSIAFLVVIPLSLSINKRVNGDQREMTLLLLIAVILGICSLIDIWVRPKFLSIVKHGKSALQVATLTLLAFTLFIFYMGQRLP